MSAHLKERVVPPRLRAPQAAIHPSLEAVVLKGLEKRPDDRYQSMADMAFDLWTALEAISAAAGAAGKAALPRADAGAAGAPPEQEGLGRPSSRVDAAEMARPGDDRASSLAGGLTTGAPDHLAGPGEPAEMAPVAADRSSAPGGGPDSGERRRGAVAGAAAVVVVVVVTALGWLAYQRLGSGSAPEEPLGGQDLPELAAIGSETSAGGGGPAAPDPAQAADAGGDDGGTSAEMDFGDASFPEGDGATEGDGDQPSSKVADRNRWRIIRESLTAADEQLRQGQPAKAAQLYRIVLRRAPRSVAAIAGLGRAEFELGNHSEAARHLSRATRLRPQNVGIRLSYAGALLRAGRASDAQKQYRAVLRLDPNNAVAKRMLE
jgi:cytochrome c-type biogenesis protein CcmH/NrfG